MAKKRVSLGIFLLLAIVITGGLWFSSPEGSAGTEAGGGSAILSLSDVTFDDSIPDIGGKDGWILTLANIPRGNDYATLGYTTLSDGDAKSTEKLRLETSLDYQECRWDVQRDRDKPVYDVEEIYYQYAGKDIFANCKFQNTDEDWCKSHSGDRFIWLSHKRSFDCIRVCYAFDLQGSVSEVMDGAAKSQTTFTLTSSEGEVAKAVLTDDDQSEKITHGVKTVGQVQLLGNLWSGKTCDNKVERQQLMAFATSTSTNSLWRPIERQDWNDYRGYDQFIRSEIEKCQNRVDEIACYEGVKSTYNNFARAAQTAETYYIYGENKLIKDTLKYDINRGYFYAKINNVVAYPLFRLFIDADFIEIGQYVGYPKILSQGSECFQTGDEGIISVEVKNIGNGKGRFEVRSECPSPFTPVASTQTRLLEAGEVQEVYINIGAGSLTAAETKKYCTITVEDMADDDRRDQATVKTCVKKLVSCSQGETRCNGNVVQICRIGEYVDSRTCDYKCVNGACIDEPSTCGNLVCEPALGETNTNCPADCEDGGGGESFQWLFALLGGAIGFLIGFKFLRRPDTDMKFTLAIAAILGLIIGIIFFTMYPGVEGLVTSIVPNFDACGSILGVPDPLCIAGEFLKLVILIVILMVSAFITLKFI